MNFKVEILIKDRIIKDRFHAEDLTELHEKILRAFPKGKIVSIIGS